MNQASTPLPTARGCPGRGVISVGSTGASPYGPGLIERGQLLADLGRGSSPGGWRFRQAADMLSEVAAWLARAMPSPVLGFSDYRIDSPVSRADVQRGRVVSPGARNLPPATRPAPRHPDRNRVPAPAGRQA